jgi:phospholipid-translocating ATPase
MFPKVLSSSRLPKQGDLWTVIPKALQKRGEDYGIERHNNNLIKTTKYTMWNFLPKNLFEQFHRFANLYFLFIIVLNFIPQINAFGKEISMIPLLFVLAVTAIKDLVEDRQRYISDKVVNNRLCDVYNINGGTKTLGKRKWRTLEVGDVIKLYNNDIIPSDILLLNTSDEDGVCHISTANLDGENNLKQKKVPKGFAEDGGPFDIDNVTFQVKCEQPNNQIHKFYGYM